MLSPETLEQYRRMSLSERLALVLLRGRWSTAASSCCEWIARIVITPEALYTKAQGRGVKPRTLGDECELALNPAGVPQEWRW